MGLFAVTNYEQKNLNLGKEYYLVLLSTALYIAAI
jgi:hypothetical protein